MPSSSTLDLNLIGLQNFALSLDSQHDFETSRKLFPALSGHDFIAKSIASICLFSLVVRGGCHNNGFARLHHITASPVNAIANQMIELFTLNFSGFNISPWSFTKRDPSHVHWFGSEFEV